MLTERALEKKNWAILGASPKKDKFSNKIMRRLMELDYNVFLVNPNYDEIDGLEVYKDISDIPEEIQVVNVVINKNQSLDFVRQKDLSKFDYIWFQPGTFDDGVINLAKEKNENVIAGECVLVETRGR